MKAVLTYVLSVLLVLCGGAAQAEAIAATRLEDSVFRDVWHAILKDADLQANLVDVGHEERRRMFVKGELVVDCCSVMAWRDRPEEMAVQLWSTPVFYTVDHLVLHQGRAYDLPDVHDLRAYRVAVVEGFSYPGDDTFGSRVVRHELPEVFDAVASGAADLTIANNQEFMRQQKKAPLPLVLGPEYQRLVLRVRVHKSRPDLLKRIDAAITRLRASGQIALLTGQRLRDN